MEKYENSNRMKMTFGMNDNTVGNFPKKTCSFTVYKYCIYLSIHSLLDYIYLLGGGVDRKGSFILNLLGF